MGSLLFAKISSANNIKTKYFWFMILFSNLESGITNLFLSTPQMNSSLDCGMLLATSLTNYAGPHLVPYVELFSPFIHYQKLHSFGSRFNSVPTRRKFQICHLARSHSSLTPSTFSMYPLATYISFLCISLLIS